MFNGIVKSIAILASLMGLIVMSLAIGNAKSADALQFADYPATEKFSGTPGEIDFSSDQRWQAVRPVVKDIVREDVAKGPNFAGAYRLGEIGCGTACQNIFAVDLRDGRTIWAPIAPTAGVLFQKDSRLIIVRKNDIYKLPRRYLVLENGKITELK